MTLHVALPVQDLEASRVFYEQLGFRFLRQFEKPEQRLRFVQLRYADQYLLELVHHPSNRPFGGSVRPETWHIGIEVADLDGLMDRLEAKNISVIKDITPGVTVRRFAFVADPNGYPVELVESSK